MFSIDYIKEWSESVSRKKKKSQFGKNKMPPKCDKLSSILTFQTAFKFL